MISVTIPLSPLQMQKLEFSARDCGYGDKVSVYAKLLFEAAFAARIGQQRQAGPMDAELDEQVSLVFRLAGLPVAAIAQGIGIPGDRVKRILEGFETYFKGGAKAPAKAARPKSIMARSLDMPLPREGEVRLSDKEMLVFLEIGARVKAGQARISADTLRRATGCSPSLPPALAKKCAAYGLWSVSMTAAPDSAQLAATYQLTPKGEALFDDLSSA